MISVQHAVPRSDVLLGILRAEIDDVCAVPPAFDDELRNLLDARRKPLSEQDEAVRRAVRDVLRNGRYKPTGRGKPASEYLLRSAEREDEAAFPRINAPVDVCNYISLKYLVPISLWDLDLAGTSTFVFRLGRPGEAYVFNQGGQAIDLEDLIVGCRLRGGTEEPIVNPVKDSLATKTTAETRHVAACVYAPEPTVGRGRLDEICSEFADLLRAAGREAAFGVAGCNETISV
ncbi:MAG TPA: phenylalanine--tRNA ligase beta subunit-related protein [Rhodothermales bacterium]|nr:phenylalanine--tRNA ligase beta subunit-related protein [Rhodothermales bacterium]